MHIVGEIIMTNEVTQPKKELTLSREYEYLKVDDGIEIYKVNYENPWVKITEPALLDEYMRLIDVFGDIDGLFENKEKIKKLLK